MERRPCSVGELWLVQWPVPSMMFPFGPGEPTRTGVREIRAVSTASHTLCTKGVSSGFTTSDGGIHGRE